MELTGLREILVNGREIVVNLASALSKLLPFDADKIAGFLVLILSFILVNYLTEIIPNLKSKLLIKIVGTGALFYILWLW